MILIADSGSTKTDWMLVDKTSTPVLFESIGLNPYHIDDLMIENELTQNLKPHLINFKIDIIHFYGSGCSAIQEKRMITVLSNSFSDAKVNVYSDILGAARALFGQDSGIASILGTGSNTVVFENGRIEKGIESMGYLLGDEGSGAVLGHKILKTWLRNEFDSKIQKAMADQYHLNPAEIKLNVYQKPRPNRFLATFAKLAAYHLDNEKVYEIVSNHFREYFEYQVISLFKSNNYDLGIVGSVGYYFQDIIKQIAADYGIQISKILRSPMNELSIFHRNEL